MIPIGKNIIVVDEQGNEYEATYPKRAKGLVNNGRARFVSKNKICLACPPNSSLEDKIMSENINNTEMKEQAEVSAKAFKALQGECVKQNLTEKLSINYVLEQIEKIATQTEYLNQVISELRQMEIAGPGDIGTAQKAEALGDIVKCRETTNQQLLKLYEKMYDDLKPKPSLREKALDVVNRTLNNPTCGDSEKELISDVLDTIRHMDDSNQKQSLTSKFNEITNWIKSLNRDEFDPETWEAITECVKSQLSRHW